MSSDSDALKEKLLRAARRILRPVVRLMIRNGIGANAFQELARKVYVDVAYEEFQEDGKTQTLARVSVLTGLNRKEVARLHKLSGVVDDDKVQWSRAGKVLDGWLTDPDFQSDAGFPLDLAFAGEASSFSDLVRRYSGDMYPSPLRDELLRVGAIRQVDGRLRMTKRGYVPGKDPGTKVDILGIDAAEFIETIDHNIRTEGEPLLQYKVLADNLPEDDLDAFNAFSKRVSLNAVDEIRRWLIEHDAGSDRPVGEKRFFAGVGVFQINRLRPDQREEENDEDR